MFRMNCSTSLILPWFTATIKAAWRERHHYLSLSSQLPASKGGVVAALALGAGLGVAVAVTNEEVGLVAGAVVEDLSTHMARGTLVPAQMTAHQPIRRLNGTRIRTLQFFPLGILVNGKSYLWRGIFMDFPWRSTVNPLLGNSILWVIFYLFYRKDMHSYTICKT